MSREFLSRILEQKAREVGEQIEARGTPAPGEPTYRLAEYLKNHRDRLQVIAEVRLSQVWVISISMWILFNRPQTMKQMEQ